MKKELVLVLDFGGQYNQLIARRVRELSVYSEMVPFNISYEEVLAKQPRGIILSGGPESVHVENAPTCDPRIFEMGVPVLGICYGMQLLAQHFGGQVAGGQLREYGRSILQITRPEDMLFKGLELDMQVWMSHGDSIKELPEGFQATARTSNCPFAAISNPERGLYGVQFHPEVKHTLLGMEILGKFLFEVCGLKAEWNLGDFIGETVEEIRCQVGERKVLCALSGGVDSSVAATLVHRAVGDQLICVFVDNGLMRKGEPEQVVKTFRDQMKMNLVAVDARERFINKLAGEKDPERKRKIIGEEFIRVFEEEKNKLGDIEYLVQGTIYPDIIESGTSTAHTIKSHHNVGGLPEDMDFKLIEPLRLLFKDEVRLLGEKLGIPHEILWRQPFPGPGLGVRVLEEVSWEKLELLKEADAIVREEIKKAGLENDIWQAFAVLPPVRSVGVMGDARTYAYPVIIRAVVSDDAMTAEWAHLPYELLDTMARRIVNEVQASSRSMPLLTKLSINSWENISPRVSLMFSIIRSSYMIRPATIAWNFSSI
jgi:GMP synthase (glutamine-hydrolysing)